MKKPDVISEFDYNGHVEVEWYDILDKDDIPSFDWQQVYIIGNINNKVPLVMYENDKDNLPGGRTEPGESIEDTMRREIQEELNMNVIFWRPLGYQKCIRPDDDNVEYQFRAYALLEKIGEFINDPGGSVIGYELIEINQLNNHIRYGVVGERLISNSRRYFY
jgi:ADP-ribose pyrophosphatase YjhB (NUDIX family)